MYKEAANTEQVHSGQIVFSKHGFVKLAKDNQKNAITEFVSKEQFIEEGVDNFVLG